MQEQQRILKELQLKRCFLIESNTLELTGTLIIQ